MWYTLYIWRLPQSKLNKGVSIRHSLSFIIQPGYLSYYIFPIVPSRLSEVQSCYWLVSYNTESMETQVLYISEFGGTLCTMCQYHSLFSLNSILIKCVSPKTVIKGSYGALFIQNIESQLVSGMNPTSITVWSSLWASWLDTLGFGKFGTPS